jgi:tetratricopeptide (TPR) repeat protein
MTRLHAILISLTLLLGACTSTTVPGAQRDAPDFDQLGPDEIRAELELVRMEIDAGDAVTAFQVLRQLWTVKNLAADARSEAELLLEQSALGVIEVTQSPDRLKALFGADLPGRVRVTFGVAAAQRYLEHGERLDAFRMVEKVDEAFPTHHLRPQAGAIISEAGLSLARDRGRNFFFFRVRARAPQVLEYLVLNYPLAPRVDEAYEALALLYEEDREWQLAIDRHTELLTYHPDSPLAVTSEAAIPRLRLASLRRYQYDRGQMELAEEELDTWLARHPEDDLEPEVLTNLARARRMLAQNDLGVAKFYRRIDRPFGAHFHADRALLEARTAGDEKLIASIKSFQRTLQPRPGSAATRATVGQPQATVEQPEGTQ